jgi:hypothetical protein
MGTIGVFSLQQGKHVTSGEGGLVVTGDDALARRMFLFINMPCWIDLTPKEKRRVASMVAEIEAQGRRYRPQSQ